MRSCWKDANWNGGSIQDRDRLGLGILSQMSQWRDILKWYMWVYLDPLLLHATKSSIVVCCNKVRAYNICTELDFVARKAFRLVITKNMRQDIKVCINHAELWHAENVNLGIALLYSMCNAIIWCSCCCSLSIYWNIANKDQLGRDLAESDYAYEDNSKTACLGEPWAMFHTDGWNSIILITRYSNSASEEKKKGNWQR